MAGMTPRQIQILLRVDREIALQHFLNDHLLPLLEERGYTLRNLLQALGGLAFDQQEKVVAHHLWDGVAHLDQVKHLENTAL
ncbi:hypothetical protein ICL16_03295 [Iningainema sp. BLCCT55]|uniref:Uncharacterized protein n=2 Tax=Iningainema TaxID=1932705 RepID=A0A8J6XD95_9CYAN|nr:hypothetical protein [Iningainema tapete]MBD2771173.1 hypothetical protein [Iningainema tapete BLCC-T55]